MKGAFVSAILLAVPASAFAQARVSINFGWTAPPPVIEVSPGVQVVQDFDEEVFFTHGRYWVERNGAWYWTNDYRGHWVAAGVEPVPLFLRNHRRGQYRHWKHVEHRREAIRRAELRHEERREVRREVRHEEHHHHH